MTGGAAHRRPRAAAVAVSALLLATLAACGGGGNKAIGTKAKAIKILPANLVPNEIQGLKVAQQDVTESLQQSKRAYVDSFALYGMRTPEDLLEATLEVTRFNPDANYQKDSFRQAVVGQIGSSKAIPLRMGDTTVYETTGKQQEISVWFQGRYLFVLSVRSDFGQPRSLLRQLTAVKP